MTDLSEFQKDDYLGRAAQLRHAANDAVANQLYNDAWRILEEVKHLYLMHAQRWEFSRNDAITLVTSVHEKQANILRLEGRHVEALRHFMFYAANSAKPSDALVKKLKAYLNRSKLPGASLVAAFAVVDRCRYQSNFDLIDESIRDWRATDAS